MTSSKPKRKQEKSPIMTAQQVDTMITERLVQFHRGLVERGQLKPLKRGLGGKVIEET